MRVMRFARRTLKDEHGGEVVEYAVIAGLIVVAAITVISAVGPKVVARWTSLNNALAPAPATPGSALTNTPTKTPAPAAP